MKKDKISVKNRPFTIPDHVLEGQSKLSASLKETENLIINILGENDDFQVKHFKIFGQYHSAMFYFTNLVNQDNVNKDILRPLMYVPEHLLSKEKPLHKLIDIIMQETLYHGQAKVEESLDKLIAVLLRGETVICVDGVTQAIHISTREVEHRSVSQPETEQVILGPREGFIENIDT